MKRVPTRRAASSRPSMGVGAGTLWREESACFSWLLASLQLLLFVSNLQPVPKEGEPAPPPQLLCMCPSMSIAALGSGQRCQLQGGWHHPGQGPAVPSWPGTASPGPLLLHTEYRGPPGLPHTSPVCVLLPSRQLGDRGCDSLNPRLGWCWAELHWEVLSVHSAQ